MAVDRLLGLVRRCVLALALVAAPAAAGAREATVIALEGAIGPASADYVVRALKAAEQRGAGVVVLRIDTPGGLQSAMRDIVRAMLASPVPVIAWVAPGGARAASAGTYILYASALAAMAPGTNLGAATPVPLFGGAPRPPDKTDKDKPDKDKSDRDKPEPAGAPHDPMTAKLTNDAAAYVRGLATLHGRNGEWAERAVREAVSLPYDAARDQKVVELIAPTLADLLAAADGRTVVVNGAKQRLATKGLDVVTIEPGWRDRLLVLLTHPSIVYLLLLAGVAGLAFELSHPGVVAPGVVGAICLLLGGYALQLLPVDYAGAALALLGIGLMVAEAFVPAFGSLGIGGAAAFAIGSLMMFDDPGFRPPLALVLGTAIALAALFGVVLGLALRARRRPLVVGNAALIGATARATRWTGAEGEVVVQGERWQARVAGAPVALTPGRAVRVVDRQGLVLVVEPLASSGEVP